MQFRRAKWDLCLFSLTADFIRLLMRIQHHLISSSAPLLTTTTSEVWFLLRSQHRHCKLLFFFPSENKLDMHYGAVMLPVSVYSTDLQLVKTSQEMKTRDCEQSTQVSSKKLWVISISWGGYFLFMFFLRHQWYTMLFGEELWMTVFF